MSAMRGARAPVPGTSTRAVPEPRGRALSAGSDAGAANATSAIREERQMFKIEWSGLAGALSVAGALLVGAPAAQAQDDYEWPSFFNVITPIVGTANHSLAVAWTSEFSASTGGRARVLPAANGFTRGSWLNTGEGRLALVQASDYFDQMDGIEGYATEEAGPADTRVIHMNMVTPWGYMVRGDSDIESIEDIGPGTRIAYASSSSFLLNGIDALLAYRDLDHDEVELVEVGNYGANTRIVVEGRAEVTFTSPISGTSYEAAAAPNGIRWLELPAREDDPEAFERYRALQPGYVPQVTEAGVESAQGVRMDHAFQTNHVRAEEDPEFVYNLVKWLEENHDAYADDFTHAYMLSVDNLVAFLETGALQPLHEGTIRYLEEEGLWTEAFQQRQDQLVEMAQERVALFDEAVAAARDEGLSIGPGNEAWVEFWTEFRTEHSGPEPYGQRVLALD
ncbi:hypothetical protein C2I36_12170 [Rhodobacteraceae bacterium WD3A24]|nr:hypothetical protein C2I36_12170 [Rhodobacteraceae bacterium WD3A24]